MRPIVLIILAVRAAESQAVKYVYLLQAGKGRYKVGIASNMLKRVKALQTSNADPVEVVTSKQTPDAVEFERSIHESLEAMKLNGGREWFSLTDEQAIDIAVLINRSPGIGISDIEALREMLSEHYGEHQSATDALRELLTEQSQRQLDFLDQYAVKQKKINTRIEDIIAQIKFDKVLSNRSPQKQEESTDEPNAADDDIKALYALRDSIKQNEEKTMYDRAVEVVAGAGKASTSMLQRRLSIGYGRAARIIEQMEVEGIVGPAYGSRPREVFDIRDKAVEIAKSRIDI